MSRSSVFRQHFLPLALYDVCERIFLRSSYAEDVLQEVTSGLKIILNCVKKYKVEKWKWIKDSFKWTFNRNFICLKLKT